MGRRNTPKWGARRLRRKCLHLRLACMTILVISEFRAHYRIFREILEFSPKARNSAILSRPLSLASIFVSRNVRRINWLSKHDLSFLLNARQFLLFMMLKMDVKNGSSEGKRERESEREILEKIRVFHITAGIVALWQKYFTHRIASPCVRARAADGSEDIEIQ